MLPAFGKPSCFLGLSDLAPAWLVLGRGERGGGRGLSAHDRDGRGTYGLRGGIGAAGMGNRAAMQDQMQDQMQELMQELMNEAFGGAHLRLHRGDEGIDIRCPSDVPFHECTKAALKMLDRLSGATSTAPGTTTR